MQSFKWEGYKSVQETVQELLGSDDLVILQFDVIPLDYTIKDILSPQIFVSEKKLVFFFDETIEVYEIQNIAIWILGGKPNFTLTGHILEPRIDYIPSNTPLSKNIDIPENFLRFAIMEKNSQQKEFVLRKDRYPAKTYQTWAFAQFVRNLQKGHDDYRLRQMVSGYFSMFDGMFLIGAFLIFIVYLLISVLLGGILPDLLLRILDTLFAIVCIVVLGWTFWTIFVNIRRYRKVYEGYNKQSSNVQKQI